MTSRILLTRPEGENEALAEALRAEGLEVRCLPLLAIDVIAENPRQRQIITQLDRFELVIVVSKPAARALVDLVDRWWPQPPVGLCWFALGQGTASILQSAGLPVHMPSQGHTSEALLDDPHLPHDLHRALIVSGTESRDVLDQALTKRGIAVERLSLYTRTPVEYTPRAVCEALEDWQPDVILTLSAETLRQLVTLGDNSGYSLRKTGLVVPSERVAALAREYSDHVSLLPDMTLTSQVQTLCGAIKGST